MMKIKWWWYVLPCVLFYLPFSFSPMCLWDSAVQQHLYNKHNYEAVKQLCFDSGVPTSYFYFRLLGALPEFVMLSKLIIILIFCLGVLLTSNILHQLNLLTDFEIYSVSVISFFYPVYAMTLHFIMLPYYISLLCFLGAVNYFLRHSEDLKTKGVLWIAILLVITFNIQSFLVYELVLLAIYFFITLKSSAKFSSHLIHFTKKHYLWIALPFFYYFFIHYFFPREGIYKVDSYNTLQFNVLFTSKELLMSTFNMSVTPWMEAIRYFGEDLRSALTYLVIALSGALLFIRKIIFVPAPKKNLKWALIFAGVALATLIPYALVGKHVSTHGFETRHSLLAHTPSLISLLIFLRYVGRGQKYIILGLFVLAFFLFLKHQIHWENRYQKYQAIIFKLQQLDKEKLNDVVFITEKNHSWAMNEYLRFYECTMLLSDAFHTERHLGINDEREIHSSSLAQHYINTYSPYKSTLFFSDFNEQANFSEIEIKEVDADAVSIFINSLRYSNRAEYYSHFITVDLK